MLQRIFHILFPRRCPICDRVLAPGEDKICRQCRKHTEVITEPICKRCGKPIAKAGEEFCFDCSRKQVSYERGYAVWVYDKYMKKSIASFKYSGRKEYGRFYVEELVYHLGSRLEHLRLDAVMPVPLHKERLRFRGFNQAELLAEGIGKKMGVPVYTNLLLRVKNTKPQKGLNDKERHENLRHAFKVNSRGKEICPKLKRVLLVDDIYTTGATIDACAKALKKAGVSEVYFVCLCIGKDF